MIGRQAAIGLSLLCTLLCGAFAAPGASATLAKNTTAFTCVPNGGNLDFSDAHCDHQVGEGTGSFGHQAIPLSTTTEVVQTNESTKNETTERTPAILKGELLKAKVEISCQKAEGKGTFKNEEPESKVHRGSGEGSTEITECTVVKPAKCKVKEPIAVNVTAVPVEELNGTEKNMGGEIKGAKANETFTEITFEGAECGLKGPTFPIKGSLIATGAPAPNAKYTGATAIYSPEKEMEKLELGARPAEISITTTVRRAPVEGVKQFPLAGTTTT